MTAGGGLGLLAVFGAMGVVTYLPRVLPLVLLAERSLPPRVLRFLEFIPVAVLAAFVAPLVLAPDGSLDVSPGNLTLLASLPTVAVALKTRSLIFTVVVGIVAMMLLRTLII
jgi:branched-subunit amino acid transport protein